MHTQHWQGWVKRLSVQMPSYIAGEPIKVVVVLEKSILQGYRPR
jgi:hypothetical protein